MLPSDARPIQLNGHDVRAPHYEAYHHKRIASTVQKLHDIGARNIVEVGSHPWVMTAALIEQPAFTVCATVSAEEVMYWPDDIGVTAQPYHLHTPRGHEAWFTNYSANVERTRFEMDVMPDTVIACEIIEHLIRAPHVMCLNINRWLPIAGKLLLTTPNGAQFANPLRRRSSTPAYRSHLYERHAYLYTLKQLTELLSLCGFRIVEAGYWNIYTRRGLPMIYKMLAHLPWTYCHDKFMQTLYVVGEKAKDVTELEKSPQVYDPRGHWEFIAWDCLTP